MSRSIDLTGRVFDRLTVTTRIGSDKKGVALWRCRCACGASVIGRSYDLRQGNQKSCGCLRRDVASRRGQHLKAACETCAQEFEVYPSTSGRRFCSLECYAASMRL